VNRSRPELVAEQMTAKAARECDPVGTDPTPERYYLTEGRDKYPRVVVKFEVQRARRFRAPGYGKHNG
jgi:hypothetical protein